MLHVLATCLFLKGSFDKPFIKRFWGYGVAWSSIAALGQQLL